MKENLFLVESLKKLLRRGATTHLHNMLLRVRPADLAEAFRSLDESERLTAFRLLAERATSDAADLLVALHPALITDLLRE